MYKLKKGSLKVKLLMALKNSNKEMVLKEIYSLFSDQKKTTCRGRLNEAVKQGFVKRTAEATYKFIGELIANDDSIGNCRKKRIFFYCLFFIEMILLQRKVCLAITYVCSETTFYAKITNFIRCE